MPAPADTILIATRELRGVLVPHLPEGNAFRCHQSQSPWSVAKCEREDPVSGAKDELSLLDRWSANLLMRSRIVPKAQRDSLLASTADSLDRQWGKRDHCTMEGQLAPLHSWRKGVWGGRAMLIPMQDTVALVVMVLMVPLDAIGPCMKAPPERISILGEVYPGLPPLADTAMQRVKVWNDSARFIFPRSRQLEYVWWDSAGRAGDTVHRWMISYTRNDSTYAIQADLPAVAVPEIAERYSRNRPIPPGTQRGPLSELVGATEMSAWAADIAGPRSRPLSVDVRAHVEQDRVVLTVLGGPRTTEFLWFMPDKVWFTETHGRSTTAQQYYVELMLY